MAREYGQNLIVTVTARVTEQEKKAIKAAAEARGMAISDLIRLALTEYLKESK